MISYANALPGVYHPAYKGAGRSLQELPKGHRHHPWRPYSADQVEKRIIVAKMPLPEDSAIVETAGSLVKTLQGAFGTPGGFRPGE